MNLRWSQGWVQLPARLSKPLLCLLSFRKWVSYSFEEVFCFSVYLSTISWENEGAEGCLPIATDFIILPVLVGCGCVEGSAWSGGTAFACVRIGVIDTHVDKFVTRRSTIPSYQYIPSLCASCFLAFSFRLDFHRDVRFRIGYFQSFCLYAPFWAGFRQF